MFMINFINKHNYKKKEKSLSIILDKRLQILMHKQLNLINVNNFY